MASIITTNISFVSAQAVPTPQPMVVRDAPHAQSMNPQQLAQVSKVAAEKNTKKAPESDKRGLLDAHARAEGSFAPEHHKEKVENPIPENNKTAVHKRHGENLDLEV